MTHGPDAPVVALKTYKLARRAADALVGLLHGPEWLLHVRVELTSAGEPVVVVVVAKKSTHILAALPRSIDGIAVQARGVQDSGEAA